MEIDPKEQQVLDLLKMLGERERQLADLKKELALCEFRKESYIKDSWKTAAQRDEARREICEMLAKAGEGMLPEQVAEKRSWGCFDSVTRNSQQLADVRSEKLDKRNEIADEILGSEQFMWLMVGANHQDQHLRDLRPAWMAWIDAGGKSYGKRK